MQICFAIGYSEASVLTHSTPVNTTKEAMAHKHNIGLEAEIPVIDFNSYNFMSANRKEKLKKTLNEVGNRYGIPVVNATGRVSNAMEKCKVVETVLSAQQIFVLNSMNHSRLITELPELYGVEEIPQNTAFYVLATNAPTLAYMNLYLNSTGFAERDELLDFEIILLYKGDYVFYGRGKEYEFIKRHASKWLDNCKQNDNEECPICFRQEWPLYACEECLSNQCSHCNKVLDFKCAVCRGDLSQIEVTPFSDVEAYMCLV
jgi:hypothetical protein